MLATFDPTYDTSPIAVAESTTDVIELWLYGKSPRTQDAYRRDVNSFIAFLDGKSIERWTVNDIQAFGTALVDRGLKPATVNRKVLAIKSLLTYTTKLGLLRANAGAVVIVKALPDNLSEYILTESQVMEMIYKTDHLIERAIIKLLYATGLRVSELCNLKWSDAIERDGAIQITIVGKGNKTRTNMIKPALWAEVEVATGRTGEFVFATKSGKPFDRARVHRIVKKAGERIGVALASAHWLRHSHASHSLDRGCPIHTVQRSLGHASIVTTQRYLHARPEDGSGLHLAI